MGTQETLKSHSTQHGSTLSSGAFSRAHDSEQGAGTGSYSLQQVHEYHGDESNSDGESPRPIRHDTDAKEVNLEAAEGEGKVTL